MASESGFYRLPDDVPPDQEPALRKLWILYDTGKIEEKVKDYLEWFFKRIPPESLELWAEHLEQVLHGETDLKIWGFSSRQPLPKIADEVD